MYQNHLNMDSSEFSCHSWLLLLQANRIQVRLDIFTESELFDYLISVGGSVDTLSIYQNLMEICDTSIVF